MRAGILLIALSALIGGVTLPSDVYAAKGHCGTSSATCYHKERIARHFEQVIKRFKKTELPNRVRPEAVSEFAQHDNWAEQQLRAEFRRLMGAETDLRSFGN